MKARFAVPLTLVLGLGLALFFELGSVFPAAQDSNTEFWVFDGHMHPTSSRQSGNMGDADYSFQFTLPKAVAGGLGAGFFNSGVDEFYEANHLAVKEILRGFDSFYRQIALYPDQVGVATDAQHVRTLRSQGKIAGILAIEGAIAIESDLGVKNRKSG